MSGRTATACTRPASIFDIQQWIAEHHGFVPHPFWIDHCLELYVDSSTTGKPRPPWHECPEDKREAIREAFIHFDLLPAIDQAHISEGELAPGSREPQ